MDQANAERTRGAPPESLVNSAKASVNRNRRREDEAERVVRSFVRQINRRDTESLLQLMTSDHVLIDSLGHRLSGGPEALRTAWAGYFGMVPDYQIKAKAIFARGNTVVIVGVASGCYVATPSRGSRQVRGWWA